MGKIIDVSDKFESDPFDIDFESRVVNSMDISTGIDSPICIIGTPGPDMDFDHCSDQLYFEDKAIYFSSLAQGWRFMSLGLCCLEEYKDYYPVLVECVSDEPVNMINFDDLIWYDEGIYPTNERFWNTIQATDPIPTVVGIFYSEEHMVTLPYIRTTCMCKLGQSEFEIVNPYITPETAYYLIRAVACSAINNPDILDTAALANEVNKIFDVEFAIKIHTVNGYRRIFTPDDHGKYPWDEDSDDELKYQLERVVKDEK